MQLTALFDKIAGRQREREHARQIDFRTIVIQIADGREPDADHVDRVLRDTDKTLDDLRQEVEHLQRRRELRDRVDQVPVLAAERKEIEKQLEAANQALDDAEEKHTETTEPLITRLSEIRDATIGADAAKRELVGTCTDADLLDELNAVCAKLSTAHSDATKCRDVVKHYRDQARGERDAAERAKSIWRGEDQVEEHLEQAKLLEQKVTEHEVELAKIEKRIAKLEREEADIRERMLVP
jgi:predicted  nucleic acid-binding Zn-ribbon protein